MPIKSRGKRRVSTPAITSPAPMTARPYPSARPGRRPNRAIRRASGQLASAVPSAPTATGKPVQALVPVISAAMIPPTAIPIDWPALAQTWAAKSAPIRRPRDHVASIAAGDTGLVIERATQETVPDLDPLVNGTGTACLAVADDPHARPCYPSTVAVCGAATVNSSSWAAA